VTARVSPVQEGGHAALDVINGACSPRAAGRTDEGKRPHNEWIVVDAGRLERYPVHRKSPFNLGFDLSRRRVRTSRRLASFVQPITSWAFAYQKAEA
jgi:hypothetical protein